MWLLPVVAWRHGFVLAARTPLRILVAVPDARDAATGADGLTAARRSRGKQEKEDKSGNILLAPSIEPRFLRRPGMNGTNRPRAHCELSTPVRCAVYGLYLGDSAYFFGSCRPSPHAGRRPFGRAILPYRELYAFVRKTATQRITTPHVAPCTTQ